jgi:hypothetical protein
MKSAYVKARWLGVLGSMSIFLAACDSGSSSSPISAPAPAPTSYVGTTGVFAAAADPTHGTSVFLAKNMAGKRQYLKGTVDPLTGIDTGQAAGVELYKAGDGHIYAVDLTSSSMPAPVQISSESAATIDDACTFGGATLPAANSDYAGVFSATDFVDPAHFSYFYRLAGPDGVCNTADDVIHLVRTGMGPSDPPIVAQAMPAAAVYSAAGALTGFVAKQGANLVLLDVNAANPVVLGTFAAPIAVATALPSASPTGLPTGSLFVVDGNIVYVNYANQSVSAPLFTIPNWTVHTTIDAAASATTLYFAIVIPASGSTPASSTIYSMPADGSAAAAAIDTEVGYAGWLTYPVQGTQLLFTVVTGIPASNFAVKAIAAAGGAPNTLVSIAQNGGRFIATASAVYYTSFTAVYANAGATVTRSAIQSGIVGTDGTVIQAPTANSEFMMAGEQLPIASGAPLAPPTAYKTVFRVSNLTSVVTVTSPLNVTSTTPGLSGGLLEAFDTSSNQIVASIGTLPASNATYLVDPFRGLDDVGYIDATNDASTLSSGTRDLYLLNARGSSSLVRVTGNL